jgi:LPS sulfotransferase NodH
VLASSPRTGSTLLCRTLWDLGLVGAPKEYLNPMQIRDWEVRLGHPWSRGLHALLQGPAVGLAGRGRWTDDRLRRHLARVRSRRSSPTGWFGLKIHQHHFQRWFLDAGRPVPDWLGPTTWLAIRRRDRVAQAVSWARAMQTGQWASHQRGYAPPRYDATRIARLKAEAEAQDAAWDTFFDAEGIQPLRLDYERLTRDLDGTVRAVLDHLGVAWAGDLGPPPLARQADAISAEWIERFRREHAA